jgi:tartrate/fumarate subfamily iron-sulfur-dependent hydro-lyase alpha chain
VPALQPVWRLPWRSSGDTVSPENQPNPKGCTVKIALSDVEEAAKELYIRALKILPPDIKEGLTQLVRRETAPVAQRILGTMVTNISVAEEQNNLLCQDTGVPIYKVVIGSGVEIDGYALKQAIRKGCERATREHPLRSSVVHPLTRKNEHTSCGIEIPAISIDFTDTPNVLTILMIPKGSGSENNSFLKMAIPAEGIDAIKKFTIDCVLAAGGKTCPPTIVGVGIGGTSELCVALAKRASTRALGSSCADPEGAKLERQLSEAVNQLGVGPQGLGGDATAFAVHIELAATHITMNPVAVNMQCHSARRATATFTPQGTTYGF